MAGANPDALVRLVSEFTKAEPQARNAGIYAAKGGYHNTRAHHLAGTYGGSKTDYSIVPAADKLGSSTLAAATDISFEDARLRSDFHTIAKYSARLYRAFSTRDKRLFYQGQAVVREFFGNIDLDRTVEGWSLYRGYALSSDPTHQWHIHISFHRKFVENWDAVRGVLDVLLARTQEDDPMADLTSAQLNAIAKAVLTYPGIANRNDPSGPSTGNATLGGLVGNMEATQDVMFHSQQGMVATVGALKGAVDTLTKALAAQGSVDEAALVKAVQAATEAGASAALAAAVDALADKPA